MSVGKFSLHILDDKIKTKRNAYAHLKLTKVIKKKKHAYLYVNL